MQAILILAHKNPEQVLELSRILKPKFSVYIHFDKKMHLTKKYKKELEENDINYISEFDVKWGSWSIVEATISLIKLVLQNKDIEYLHLISGQDWPIKNLEETYNFFEANKKYMFMTNFESKNIKKSGEPIIWWQKYYYNYDNINRKSTFGKIYHRINILVQTIIRINKFKKLSVNLNIYSGSQWFDAPRDMVEYAVKYLEDNKNVKKMFKSGFCSDEFWLQTILCNNQKLKNRIINDNKRYIDWTKKNESYPAVLDLEDYDSLKESNAFFARKIDFKFSKKLINKLNKNIILKK